ncbi:hypothetical protein CGK02_22155, partial [Vibrio parahaemolyticus]
MKDRILEFYNADFEGTLFPMETCRVVIENAFDELVAYIEKVATKSEPNFSFLAQQDVYASKAKQHLRRTKKLDPVAEFYLYYLCYKNRSIFNRYQHSNRQSYGYKFSEG